MLNAIELLLLKRLFGRLGDWGGGCVWGEGVRGRKVSC